jgi:hypothetical protein
MATMLSLPTETLVKVFESVDAKDLKSLRSTCKRLEGAATPRFAAKYFVDRRHVMTLKSIKALEDIVLHQYFGNFVQSIAFNCVRTIPPDALNKEDIRDPVPPLQVNPEEGRDQSYAKLTKLVNIVKRIYANHGKIGLGVFFENFYDEQPCHGLVDGLRYCTIDWSTGYRPSYSMMHLRNTLRTLLKLCERMRCPVRRIEVDLGRHSTLFRRMVRYHFRSEPGNKEGWPRFPVKYLHLRPCQQKHQGPQCTLSRTLIQTPSRPIRMRMVILPTDAILDDASR